MNKMHDRVRSGYEDDVMPPGWGNACPERAYETSHGGEVW